MLAYGLLMGWFCLLYRSPGARLAHALAFFALGVGLEFAQAWTGYRSYEGGDMLADALGVLAGWAAAPVLAKLAPRIGAR